MLITIDQVRKHITTDLDDEVLEDKLLALELDIRKHAKNNFQNTMLRFISDSSEIRTSFAPYFKIGDTLQVSQSPINNGLYTIKSIVGDVLTLNEPIYSEQQVLFTKVEYPFNVQMGAIDMLRWKLQNEDHNYNPEADRPVQSESLSRRSVTYAKDTSEEDIHPSFGVPRKYTAFLKPYMKSGV